MFSGSSFTLASKTRLIFSWNDNLHDGKQNLNLRLKLACNDLLNLAITVRPLPNRNV